MKDCIKINGNYDAKRSGSFYRSYTLTIRRQNIVPENGTGYRTVYNENRGVYGPLLVMICSVFLGYINGPDAAN